MADYFNESFNNGIGALGHAWGWGNLDTSVPGQVTVSGNAGMMETPWGASSGHGYGTYSVTASLQGNTQGPAALLWPANDVWPGGEYDMVEIHEGTAYGTVHWNAGGGDRYDARLFNGIDESQVHTYTLDWQPGRITYAVDGQYMGEVTGNVGADAAHGGVNVVMGVMNNNWGTSITVYDMSYSPSGGGSAPAPAPAAPAWSPEPAAAPEPSYVSAAVEIDWNALAAQVYQHYLDTGVWG